MAHYRPAPFMIAPDAIDPAKVPCRTLRNGAKLPAIGLGTFGSDRFGAKEIAAAVKDAISLGYRHIDCAQVYGNEKEIGQALGEVLSSGLVKREELFITSKVWNDMHGAGDVLVSCATSLRDLGLDYLDLYLVHWPFPNYHAPFCDIDARNPDSRPFFAGEFLKTWAQMERLVDMGLVKAIGTSNMTLPKLQAVLPDMRIRPACNEMELHPYFQQRELFDFVISQEIVPIGFCPIGSPKRPERDTDPADRSELEDPVLCAIAAAHGVHPAIICLKWAVQNGQVPIPFSVHRNNYRANLLCATEDPLTPAEMDALNALDRDMRLIKGHVFLWEGAEDWYNLWDRDGVIDRTGWNKD